jgi:hypothetical protein
LDFAGKTELELELELPEWNWPHVCLQEPW